MDFSFPADVVAAGDALIRFIDTAVIPLETAHRELLQDERACYASDGQYSPRLLELRREVRMKSAQAGFYGMFAAPELGGAGFGPIAAAYIHDLLNARYGPEWHFLKLDLPGLVIPAKAGIQ